MAPDHEKILRQEIRRAELQIFTAVRLARRAVMVGDLQGAVVTLRADADKIRPLSPALYEVIKTCPH